MRVSLRNSPGSKRANSPRLIVTDPAPVGCTKTLCTINLLCLRAFKSTTYTSSGSSTTTGFVSFFGYSRFELDIVDRVLGFEGGDVVRVLWKGENNDGSTLDGNLPMIYLELPLARRTIVILDFW
jgi:hypothetical protein